MPQYRVLQPIAVDGRRERGEIITISEDLARAFGAEYVERVDESVKTAQPESEPATAGEVKVEGEAPVKVKNKTNDTGSRSYRRSHKK